MPEPLTYEYNKPGGISRPLWVNCAVCGAIKATLCSNCSSTAYCSEPCRVADEICHNLVCDAVKNLPPRPPSSSSLENYYFYKLGFLFHEQESRVQPLWVKFEKNNETGIVIPSYGDILKRPPGATTITRNDEPLNGRDGFDIGRTLNIWYHDDFLYNDEPNKAIMAASKGLMQETYWRGPVLVTAEHIPGRFVLNDSRNETDAYAIDVRSVVDYLAAYPRRQRMGRRWPEGFSSQSRRTLCLAKIPASSDSSLPPRTINGMLPSLMPNVELVLTDNVLKDVFTRNEPLLKPEAEHLAHHSAKAIEEDAIIRRYLKNREVPDPRPWKTECGATAQWVSFYPVFELVLLDGRVLRPYRDTFTGRPPQSSPRLIPQMDRSINAVSERSNRQKKPGTSTAPVNSPSDPKLSNAPEGLNSQEKPETSTARRRSLLSRVFKRHK